MHMGLPHLKVRPLTVALLNKEPSSNKSHIE